MGAEQQRREEVTAELAVRQPVLAIAIAPEGQDVHERRRDAHELDIEGGRIDE
jgi:hypothetical protein